MEDIDQADLDAEMEVEREAQHSSPVVRNSPKKRKAEPELDVDEEEEDDGISGEQAEEDNEEPEQDGDSREPSDAESLDHESDDSREGPLAKRRLDLSDEHSKAIAKKFIDDEAEEDEEEKEARRLMKGLTKRGGKLAKDEDEADERNEYEKDSIMDDDDEVVYESDYENELQRKEAARILGKEKKKSSRSPKKLIRKRKMIRPPSPSSSSSEEEEEADGASEENGEDEDAIQSAKKVSRHDIENMKLLNGTSASSSIKGTEERKKAKFHEYATVDKASNKSADSPEKPKKKKPTTKSTKSPRKSTASKKCKSVPKWQVGDVFQSGKEDAYRVTYRGKDTPTILNFNNKRGPDTSYFHPDYWTTAEKLVQKDGEWIGTGAYWHFITAEGMQSKPIKANKNLFITQWRSGGGKLTDKERTDYVERAILNKNFRVSHKYEERLDDNAETVQVRIDSTFMYLIPELFQLVQSETHVSSTGDVVWTPDTRKVNPVPTSAPAKITITKQQSPKKKQKVEKPTVIKREEGCQDISKMLSNPPSTPARAKVTVSSVTPLSASKSFSDSLFDEDEDMNDANTTQPQPSKPYCRELVDYFISIHELYTRKEYANNDRTRAQQALNQLENQYLECIRTPGGLKQKWNAIMAMHKGKELDAVLLPVLPLLIPAVGEQMNKRLH